MKRRGKAAAIERPTESELAGVIHRWAAGRPVKQAEEFEGHPRLREVNRLSLARAHRSSDAEWRSLWVHLLMIEWGARFDESLGLYRFVAFARELVEASLTSDNEDAWIEALMSAAMARRAGMRGLSVRARARAEFTAMQGRVTKKDFAEDFAMKPGVKVTARTIRDRYLAGL